MHKSSVLITTLLILVFLLGACTSLETEQVPDISQIVAQTQTAIAQNPPATVLVGTPQVLVTQTATSAPASPTVTSAPPTPTHTATATASPTPADPTPTASCTDFGRFISETIPDGSAFTPGQKFTKSWTLRNTGSCTWNERYAVVHVNGDLLGAPESVQLTVNVSPNADLKVSIEMTAPDKTGTYRSEWKLRNERQEVFGLGKDTSAAFWVEINVVEPSAGPSLGQPAWSDTFDNNQDRDWDLGDDGVVSLDVDDGKLFVSALEQAGDQWRIALLPDIANFFIQTTFTTTDPCVGKDSYGFILRAPDTSGGIIDSGYVFGFSCDGYFRVYRMDNGVFNNIQGWTLSPNLLSGPGVDNKIAVLAQGAKFTLTINDVQVFEFTDASYSVGIFGLMVRANDSESFTYTLDSIAYWDVP